MKKGRGYCWFSERNECFIDWRKGTEFSGKRIQNPFSNSLTDWQQKTPFPFLVSSYINVHFLWMCIMYRWNWIEQLLKSILSHIDNLSFLHTEKSPENGVSFTPWEDFLSIPFSKASVLFSSASPQVYHMSHCVCHEDPFTILVPQRIQPYYIVMCVIAWRFTRRHSLWPCSTDFFLLR